MKMSNKKKPGLLQPLEIPDRTWQNVHYDFITGLLLTKDGNEVIFTMVDSLSKMAHFKACKSSVTSKEAALLFINDVYRLHGMPEVVTLDRDPKFTSEFYTELFDRLKIKRQVTTAYHPESNGQAEIVNKAISKMLRAFAEGLKNDWDTYLGLLEFAYNSAKNVSTGLSPFYIIYGKEPQKMIDLAIDAGSF